MEKASKKPTPAAPGKKKVIRRLVKNAKTGEIIKTEIVRIDSSGERTVTSYPAGTPVPSLSSLQSQSSQVKKTSTRKPSVETKPSPSPRRPSKEDSTTTGTHPETPAGLAPPHTQDIKPKPHLPVKDEKIVAEDVGPSVPANVPGLEDLIKKEEEIRRMSESGLDRHEKPKSKAGEESLETALISIMRKKRQRDPKARRRGLVASTMARRTSDDELDKALDDAYEDTDYRTMHSKKDENQEDEEAEKKRKERHRRRKEKKQKERSQADRDDVEEYQGETGPLNLPEIDSYRKRDEETPMEGVEGGVPPETAEGDEEELSKKLEDATIKPEEETQDQPVREKDEDESGSEDDKKKKKKKHKHKKKKKKAKKQKKRGSKSGSEKEDEKEERERRKSRSRSRSRSLSSLSMSSISSAFSDSFDFAGMNFDPGEDGGFDKALIEYQQVKEQVMGSQFAGRGFDPFFRGRGGFPRGRGFPGGRFPGPFPGPPWGGPGPMFHFYQPDPNFMFPGGMGPEGDKGRGRGVPASQGPWRGRGLRGRGVPPGFHRNYTEDDQGGGLYVEDSNSSGSESGRKKKKKKHRRRSYSSSSYSSSDSSRSRSRSRRRHRRRHRSSSYSSRSSRSYSRSSYSSRSYRSYSRSSRSSYSRSSYSRSRSRSRKSRSQSREDSRKPFGYEDGERRASPSYHAYDEDGFKPPVREQHSDDEEVPWWAEFDKTYEVEKKREEEKKKLEEEKKAIKGEPKEPQLPSIVSTDEIDVVRCVMTLVDKAKAQQDEVLESARECIDDIITKITTVPVQATQLHEEVEDPFDKVIHDCVESILDRVCPNDPQTAARLCLKEIIDTVVEQEEEDKANEAATEMEKEITESAQSKLYQCYLKAQKLTEQIKAERKAKGLVDEGTDAGKDDNEDDKGKGDDRKRDKRGHRSRHRRRSRSRDRGRRRRRHTSSDSRSSSRSSDARIPLVSKESLQQAQAVLMMQQQQLQVAGLLGTGMPNLAGLNQAAALAAGITPALLAQTGLRSSDLPTLTGEKPQEKTEEETAKFTKWDKDKDAMSKKDDLTRKLMQRMREKKLKQEEGDESPTFQSRNKEKAADSTMTDKVFSGATSLKSRKIAISSTFGKLWSKVEGSPKRDDDTQESKPEVKGYNKSDIIAAAAEGKGQMQPSAERLKAEEQEKKLAAWSDEQAKLKEAAKREMREQIERAERAKKEQMKEEILEQERQKEIMRIREEVRNQIRKEIQDEIEKQRKSVLEDPAVRGKLLELEALRSQSGLISNDVVPAAPSSNMPSSTASSSPAPLTGGAQMRDQRWYQQQMKNKQDMQKWMEGHGYFETDMDDATMKRMQMTYMQNWSPAQRQGYMRWYWQQKQYPGSTYYSPRQQHMMSQRPPAVSQGSAIPPLMGSRSQKPEFHDSIFTRAPSQPQHPGSRARGPPGHRMPYGQIPPRSMTAAMMAHPQAPGTMDRPGIPRQSYQGQPPAHPPPQYHETERQTLDYNHEMRYHPRSQQPPSLPQQGQSKPVQAQPRESKAEVDDAVVDRADPNQIQSKASAAPTQQPQPQVDQPPLHQYPPPGLEEDDEHARKIIPPAAPPQAILKQVPVLGQPPPPGESSLENPGTVALDGLAPPGEETNTPFVPPGMNAADDDSPSKAKKKKKQKKHRKHKKKKYSSSDEEEENDPEAEKAAILAQLQNLKDVEDGEIASDDGAAPVKEAEKETRKKKKHKKEKRKHRRRKDDSSDDEQESQVPQPISIQSAMPTPASFYPPPGQVRPPFDMPNRPDFPGQMPGEHRPNNFPPHSVAERFGQYPPPTAPFLGDRERPPFMPHPRDRRGAGEPQHMIRRHEQRPQSMGPGGDHNPPQRKRTPSPLPLVIPTDPQEFELWQRKMEAKYNDAGPQKAAELPGPGKLQDPVNVDQQLLKDIEAIRRRQGERDLPANANEDVIMMMRMMDEEQRRQRPAHHDRPLRDGRKRGHGHMSRGRKRQRRLPRRNYHDWDKPEDDGLIYCQSGSDSSDWGSDSNMDFDRMLAKKRKEAGKRDSIPHQPTPPHVSRSPGRMMGWDRREMSSRKEDMLQGEKPQGIPVIGGGPRPIPTNVSSGRPTPPQHHHPDMMGAQGGMDFMPPDVIKLPPQFPPTSYPHDPHLLDQRRDPGFPPPPMPPSAHPIQRLGQGAPPIPPMMLNPPMQPRMHHMDFRPRYPM